MKMSRRILAAVGLVGLMWVHTVGAQEADHLKCYRIIDSLKIHGIVDLHSSQFGLEEGCKVSRAKLFCVPATKRVRKLFDGNRPIDPIAVFGPPAPGDRICYELKCPGPYPGDVVATDQFGVHQWKELRPGMLCTPAFKGEPPAPCEKSGYPTCDGDCPDPTQVCRASNDGTGRCACEDKPTPCALQADGQCGGECPTATEICQFDAVIKDCRCGPVVKECKDAFYPQCAGPCPPGEICRVIAGSDLCECQSVVTPCDLQATGQCGGYCPDPADVCQFDANGLCACGPLVVPCEDTFFPQCAGPCPPEQACRQEVGTDLCRCQPLPQKCGRQDDGTCGGDCPDPNDICQFDSTGLCSCSPPVQACEDTFFPQCAGPCPPGETCRQVAGTDFCKCQPFVTLCSPQANGECAGACPLPGDLCVPDPTTNECACVPPANCEDTTFPQCGGPCPPGEACQNVVGTSLCKCQPETQDCGFDPNGQCIGGCPDPNDKCQIDPTGTKCACQPPLLPCEETAPQCDGPCPPGLACRADANGLCLCDEPAVDCGFQPDGTCGGICPDPLDKCALVTANLCACVSPTPQCEGSAPACDGECPPGLACTSDAAGFCFCDEPIVDCGFHGGVCAGVCPNPLDQCTIPPNSNECTCVPPVLPCEDTAPSCDGPCPTGLTCVTNDLGLCFCDEPVTTCGIQADGTCGGVCPNPLDTCTIPAGSKECTCVPPTTTTCGPNSPFPQCDGTCPPGEACQGPIDPTVPGVCDCLPVDIPCEEPGNPSGPPQCWGSCPSPDMICVETPDGRCACSL